MPALPADGTWHHTADGGEQVVLHDVVGGAWPELLPSLLELHARHFPAYHYALDELRRDALRPARRDGLFVHQWVATVDGVPAGYVTGDVNGTRRVSPMTFVASDPPYRALTIGGQRFGPWLLCQGIRQYGPDTGEIGLGLGGESDNLPYLLRSGWRVLPSDYREPVHGEAWRERGLETHPIASVWLPDPSIPIDQIEHVEPLVTRAVAAAFLLDLYGLPEDLPWVRELVGEEELGRPRPDRDAW